MLHLIGMIERFFPGRGRMAMLSLALVSSGLLAVGVLLALR